MAYPSVAAQTVLIVVFAVSLASKVRSRAAWSGFVDSVRRLGQLRGPLAAVMAGAVATAELLVVGLLAVPVSTPLGLALGAALLVGFTVALMRARRRGVRAACRCFGASTSPVGIRQVVRNLLLLGAVGLAGVGAAAGTAPLHLAGLVVAVTAGLAVAVVLILLDEFVELFIGPVAGARATDARST